MREGRLEVKLLTPKQDSTRIVLVTVIAVVIALVAGVLARLVEAVIGLVTNISFHGTFALGPSSPLGHSLGIGVIVVPIIGGIIVGFMARYGSKAIRGHGIPETMEQILLNKSRIPPKVILLKPLSAAVSIGTGGPFGSEGPIIATGGALGSLVGQLLKITSEERKTLLAAVSAAGMAATFGSPVSAVLLAIELLLFEFRPRSFIPVAIASVVATAVRAGFVGLKPVFSMPILGTPAETAIVSYVLIGLLLGVASVYVTKAVYWIEDSFEKLPIHWMWWPALGGLAVGVIGYFVPRTMGVGYSNISGFLNGEFALTTLLVLSLFKFISWSIALGSGTSGGTLAPLFTIGGTLGAAIGGLANYLFPELQIDPRMAGLVGMAAMFAGASRALLASVVFAFETTLQSSGLLSILGGSSAAFLASTLLMEHTIMTEKIARRGLRVPSEYSADYLMRTLVKQNASYDVRHINAEEEIGVVRRWFQDNREGSDHQGYPVLDDRGELVGVITKKEVLRSKVPLEDSVRTLITRAPIVVYEDNTLREAADFMVLEQVGRLPVVLRENPLKVVAFITRSDLLRAHGTRLEEEHNLHQNLMFDLKTVFKEKEKESVGA